MAGKKGRVMERRLMKDFQIGMVEGIINEVIQSEKGPKDVFSKIAQAIGRRTSSKKGKKDWNAMVRSSTMSRDPIGSTSEANTRLTRQSLRRHIIENQGTAMSTMDPQRLVEYNPMLSTVSPATRVAYAKFKISKIKQEFNQKEANDSSENGSQRGDDEVFQAGPTSVTEVSETKNDASIVRPRPRASLSSLASIKSGEQHVLSPPNQDINSTSSEAIVRREFRPKTPIPEDPREDMTTPEPTTPKNIASTRGDKQETPRPSSRTSATSKAEEEKSVKGDEKKEETKEENIQKDVKKEAPKPSTSSSEPKRPAGPPKVGGKSKVTGEVLQGWL